MADIIEQMLVTLGLDTKDFDKARAQVNEGLKNTAENAKKRGGDVEGSAKGMGNAFAKLRGELTGLLLTYAGAKSITQFTQNLVNNADQVGKTAAMYGKTTEEVSAWGRVMEKNGATAADVAGNMQALQDLQARMRVDRGSVNATLLGYLGIKGSQDDIERQLGDYTGIMLTLADNYRQRMALAKGDPRKESEIQAVFKKQVEDGLHLSGDWFRIVAQGRPALEEQLRLEKERGPITQDAANAARHFNESTTNLQQSLMIAADKAGLLTTWLGGLADVADGLAGSKKPLNPETSQRVAGAMVLREPEALLAMAAHGLGLISDETERKAIARALSRSEGGRNALAWAQHPDDPQPQRSGPPPVANSPTYNALGNGDINYDTVVGDGRYGKIAATSLTMGQAYDYGRQVLIPATRADGIGRDGRGLLGSSAMGGFQITGSTLARYAPRLFGSNWRNMKYDAAAQEKIAKAIFDDSKSGNLHAIWAGLPDARRGAYAGYNWQQMRKIIAYYEGTARRGSRGATTINVDARGHPDRKGVEQAAHNGVRRALSRTSTVANANTGLN